ncbi:MAG TPA: cell division protein FtsA [Acidobacteriota bacterium]|nr:cell division protein FtsA [Acidobacteriota bacterium]
MSNKERLVCGLDIGTTKTCMVIARAFPDGRLEVVSSGYSLSNGLKKGVVVDIEEAASSIKQAAEEAELKSGFSMDWVAVGVSGDHIQSYNCHGAVSIVRKNQEVTPEDTTQVIHAAQSIPIPVGREIIHVLPQEFFLDNRGDIQNPVGLSGSRLDVNVHVVTCQCNLNQNLINAVNKADMRVKKLILQQLASAEAVLMPGERELGTAVIDIGGGTTDIALFVKNAIRYSSVIPVGGAHFTRDLAVGLRTPIDDAEKIKKAFGSVHPESIAEDEAVETPGVGNRGARALPRKMVGEILRARATELFELVKVQIERSGERQMLNAGVVITGGGSMLNGIIDLAEEVLEMPVRQGVPNGVEGLTSELSHPVYAGAIGLAMFEAQDSAERQRRPGKANPSPWLINRILSWVGS